MGRVFTKILKDKLNKQAGKIVWEILFKEIQKIHSINDLKKFFEEFLTEDERVFILRRLAIIKLIQDKKKYRDIKNFLNVSGNTISAVKDIILGYGYNKRDKTIKYSPWPKSNNKRRSFPKYPTFVGRGRWRFLNDL